MVIYLYIFLGTVETDDVIEVSFISLLLFSLPGSDAGTAIRESSPDFCCYWFTLCLNVFGDFIKGKPNEIYLIIIFNAILLILLTKKCSFNINYCR